ncbi:MAG TPA: protein kinase [Gemmatimonadaceae bacterium]|nr:protein kinase [Gemmatimonadaceae bacterium]
MEHDPTVTGEFTARYTIERELGRGGAAVVYLARDNRQERHVALKVLHKELAQAIGAKRFLREIKHSSALQHPHLLTILDSGESRGTLYYVMPYMADGSLRTRIAKEKQLPIEDSLRITRDVGEALEYAHSKGIVHRDIKPDNVLFSGDHACLADFGIARAVDSIAADTLTSTGLVVGTPAYMSPEQASGEKTVDARSDQYSLACLLYEMITGLPPFIGATQQSVISQRFTQPPPSMRVHRPNVPDHVERAVKRALAVVPADRYPTVKEFVEALYARATDLLAPPPSVHRIRRRWFAVGAAAAIVTVAVVAAKPGADWVRRLAGAQVDTSKFVVLPFRSEVDSADGVRVAAAIHAGLGRWEDLALENQLTVNDAVRERGPVRSLDDAFSIAGKLGAGRLVWGQVMREGPQTTVYAELYDVSTKKGIGRKRLSLPDGARVDTLLYDMANSLVAVDAVPPGMDGGENGTNSWGAWHAYRRGIAAAGRFDLDRARAEVSRAVELDPDFGIAHFELARIQSWLEQEETTSWQANAMRAVALAGELRPRDAKRAAALYAFSQKDYSTACRHYTDLVDADTLDARAWYGLGACLHADNRVLPDPRSPSGYRFRSSWHAAGEAFVRAMTLEPGLHSLPQGRRLGRVLPTSHNQVRSGAISDADVLGFGAIPQLVAETLAFIPYRQPNFERDLDEAARERRRQALTRNRDVVRALTSSWVRAYPASSQAHSAMAHVLEQQGELATAAQHLGMARRLAASDLESLHLAEADARVRYKNGDFAGAKAIADSALAANREVTELNWEPIARLAGMTGRVSQLEEALQFFWAKFADAKDLDQTVYRAAGQALARAVVGLCDGGPLAVEAQLNSTIRIHVQPAMHPDARKKVVGLVLSFSTPCATGHRLGAIADRDHLERAQRSFGRGDTVHARAILDTALAGRSHLRPGEISPTVVAREAFLRLAMGDTAAAIVLLDGTLDGLKMLPASTMQHPLESATLVRMMVARTDLAATRGDAATAGKWAKAVASLWAGAEGPLKPTVNRMRALAGAPGR